jgi:hypothetical protein
VSEQLAGQTLLVGSIRWSDPSKEECETESYHHPEIDERLNAVRGAADAVAVALLTTAHRTLIHAAFVPDIPVLRELQQHDAKDDMERITRIIEEVAATAFAVTIPNGMYHLVFVNAVVQRLRERLM